LPAAKSVAAVQDIVDENVSCHIDDDVVDRKPPDGLIYGVWGTKALRNTRAHYDARAWAARAPAFHR